MFITKGLRYARRFYHAENKTPFIFSPENFRKPQLPHALKVVDVPLEEATDDNLKGFGHLVRSRDEFQVEKGNFEIIRWPQVGWRSLDPHTGDEAGTTEGDFDVNWKGDYYYGKNLAVSTPNNYYLDGLGTPPEYANKDTLEKHKYIYLFILLYYLCYVILRTI